MKIEKGLRFKSTPIGLETIVTIKKVDYTLNQITVNYEDKNGLKIKDIWNLEHTIWCFEKGEYMPIGIDINEFRTKNGQLEDDGAYADDL